MSNSETAEAMLDRLEDIRNQQTNIPTTSVGTRLHEVIDPFGSRPKGEPLHYL